MDVIFGISEMDTKHPILIGLAESCWNWTIDQIHPGARKASKADARVLRELALLFADEVLSRDKFWGREQSLWFAATGLLRTVGVGTREEEWKRVWQRARDHHDPRLEVRLLKCSLDCKEFAFDAFVRYLELPVQDEFMESTLRMLHDGETGPALTAKETRAILSMAKKLGRLP